MIRWKPHEYEDRAVCGYVADRQKYYVGPQQQHYPILIADVKVKDQMWTWKDLNLPVESLEEGKQLCEMWEATGAYD